MTFESIQNCQTKMPDQISVAIAIYCATIFQGIGFDMSNEKWYQPNERDF